MSHVSISTQYYEYPLFLEAPFSAVHLGGGYYHFQTLDNLLHTLNETDPVVQIYGFYWRQSTIDSDGQEESKYIPLNTVSAFDNFITSTQGDWDASDGKASLWANSVGLTGDTRFAVETASGQVYIAHNNLSNVVNGADSSYLENEETGEIIKAD